MSKINFGSIKYQMNRFLSESILTNNNVDHSKKLFKEYIKTVKSSPLLRLEYLIYSNLESKTISENYTAAKYIDDTVSLMKGFSVKEMFKEHEKLKEFNLETDVPSDKSELYEKIDTLIKESIKPPSVSGVNKIHDSLSYLLEHVKSEKGTKEIMTESEDASWKKYFNPNFLTEHLVKKFKQKYSNTNESELKIILTLAKNDPMEINELVESLKAETISMLMESRTDVNADYIDKTILKMEGMGFDKETLISDVSKLMKLNNDIKNNQ